MINEEILFETAKKSTKYRKKSNAEEVLLPTLFSPYCMFSCYYSLLSNKVKGHPQSFGALITLKVIFWPFHLNMFFVTKASF